MSHWWGMGRYFNRSCHTFVPVNNRVNGFRISRMETFWTTCCWCTTETAIWSYIIKSVWKLRNLTEWARSPRAEIFKLLSFFDMLIFKTTKWSICIYMLFIHECTELIFMSLELVVCWLGEFQDSIPFFYINHWSTRRAECERFTTMFFGVKPY